MAFESDAFTKVVVQSMRKLYPEKIADNSFDNTGLLLEAPARTNGLKPSVLLTIDLTKAVVEEAIRGKHSVVVAYHPIIFHALKSLTLANTQQCSLLRLAQEGISVYCPHTAVDAARGGLNDWLADIVIGNPLSGPDHGKTYDTSSHTRKVINSAKNVPGFEDAGYGRILHFESPHKLGDIMTRIIKGLAPINGLSVAVPQDVPEGKRRDIQISSVGVCAGSGGSTLNGADVDLLLTGELSHHEALAAVEKGQSVITVFHSNTERKYLHDRLAPQLTAEIKEGLSTTKGWFSGDQEVRVNVSSVDSDPYKIVVPDHTVW